jgi:aldehyde dehydrogenase
MTTLDFKKLGVANPFKKKYGNFINGKWEKPVSGKYFANISPITAQEFCQIPRSDHKDITLALNAAHNAKDKWAATSVTERSNTISTF